MPPMSAARLNTCSQPSTTCGHERRQAGAGAARVGALHGPHCCPCMLLQVQGSVLGQLQAQWAPWLLIPQR